MQSLTKNFGAMQLEETSGKGLTLLEAVGNDIESSFADACITREVNDKNIISQGGVASFGENQQIQIRFTDNDALVNFDSTSLDGTIAFGTNNDTVFNMLQIFRFNYLRIGNVQYAFQDSNVYQQLCLETMSQQELQPYKDHLWVDDDRYADLMMNAPLVAASSTPQITYVTYPNGGYKDYTPAVNSCLLRSLNRKDMNFSIPLKFICPILKYIPNSTLLSHNGQAIELSLQTQPFVESLVSFQPATAGAYTATIPTSSYAIKNISVHYQYTRLDAAKMDLILKSQFEMRPTSVYNQKVSPCTTSNVFQLQISKNETMRRLLFCIAANGQPTAALLNSANTLWQTKSVYHTPTVLFPKVFIKQISLSLGGQRLDLISNQIPAIQMHNNMISDYDEDQDIHGRWRTGCMSDLRCVYEVDLDRFPAMDFIGSSANEQVLITAQILIDDGIDITGFGNRAQSTSAIILSNYDMYCFLEKSSSLYLKNGQYSQSNQ